MIVFDGTYRLERKEDPGATPAHACAWRVKIIDLASSDSLHSHIRPLAVLAFRQESGIFKTSCAESLGKRICGEFDLKVDDLLWVEAFPDLPESLYVAVFDPRYHDGRAHYRITWRPILANEHRAIAPWC